MKHRLIRLSCAALILILCVCALSACKKQSPRASAFATADNEIFTYKRIDPEKTQIVIGVSGNIYLGIITSLFMERNPDIQITRLDITGGNDVTIPVRDWLEKGYRPDILFWANNPNAVVDTSQIFEDLSTNSLLELYETEALNRVAVDGHIYILPGPSQISCIKYNTKLFEQYGWEVPKTFDEFVELCARIPVDTQGAVEAWNPNAKYANTFIPALEAFTYMEILGGAANRTWLNEYLLGNETFSGHMQPFYDAYQKLIDAGIVNEAHFTYSATTRGRDFDAGKLAFMNQTISDEPPEGVEYMPFPGKNPDEAYLIEQLSCGIGVPIKERDEKTREAVYRFLEFYASQEVQDIYIGDKVMISNIKGVASDAIAQMPVLNDALNNGHVFAWVDFKSPSMKGNYNPLNLIREDLLAICKGEMTAEMSMARIDEATRQILAGEYSDNYEVLATATEDFTILETSNFIADMYRQKAGADIGLIANNNTYRGNVMRIFKGQITTSDAEVLKPRSFENNSKLIKANMSGKQLLDALNDPVCWDDTSDAKVTYAFSGLKCEVAPWNDNGKKMVSVRLSNGGEIEADKVYTVAFWQGTVKDEYIMDVVEEYEGTFEALLKQKLMDDKEIAPSKDGRITLIW